ncbi:uncharacterized protein Triagg1_10722 [Trichoderma aggressivum f. europaeum]|uniref:Uncharacterized protein n=1 Tax=Trichoderma aggressivum f. europaeum TaxID=173218 RepID=A0AAE1LW45_9HYPO|nr:hypothetical protein Triagg1_10722 [Trichoderma aggressivum f. europaeum]
MPNTLPVLAEGEGEPIASAFPLPPQFNPSWAQHSKCLRKPWRQRGALSDTTAVAKPSAAAVIQIKRSNRIESHRIASRTSFESSRVESSAPQASPPLPSPVCDVARASD